MLKSARTSLGQGNSVRKRTLVLGLLQRGKNGFSVPLCLFDCLFMHRLSVDEVWGKIQTWSERGSFDPVVPKPDDFVSHQTVGDQKLGNVVEAESTIAGGRNWNRLIDGHM